MYQLSIGSWFATSIGLSGNLDYFKNFFDDRLFDYFIQYTGIKTTGFMDNHWWTFRLDTQIQISLKVHQELTPSANLIKYLSIS